MRRTLDLTTYLGLPAAEPWQDRAACQGTDREAFYPEKGERATTAKRVCAGCTVKAECLEYALARRERFGVWGGLTETERRRLLDTGYQVGAPAQVAA